MNYLDILRQDVLEALIKEVKSEEIETRHNNIYNYVSEEIKKIRKSVRGKYNSDKEYLHQKDKKATLDNFLDGFESSEWKEYLKSKSESPAELRKLVKNCLVESSVTKNLLSGRSIAPKSKDFYSVYLFYNGWVHFSREKSKNRNHKNKGNRLPKELTVKFPKTSQNQIVGRELDIEELRERLFDNKQVVLMNGMGGIGKTTVASVYATEYYPYYKHIVWISQLSDSFLNDFVNTRGLLEVLKIDSTGKNLQELFDETIMCLKGINNIPCLMVIDNAKEELYKYYDLLPSQPNWHILVTSREIIPHFDIQDIDFLSVEKAIELFEKLYSREDFDKSTIEQIVEYLDYHTLTIEILALTAKKQGLSLGAILSAIEKNIETGVIIRHSDDKIKNITSYLCFIFENITELNEDEKWLLIQFACLPSEFHVENLLRELIQPKEERETKFKLLLSDLSEKGWLLHNKGNKSYKMHRIIIDVVNQQLSIKIQHIESLVDKIKDNLEINIGEDNPSDKFLWIPYAKSITYHFDKPILSNYTSLYLSLLWENLAIVLYERKDDFEAKKFLEKAINSLKLNLGENHLVTLRVYNMLGLVHRRLENYELALKIFAKILSIKEQKLGEDDINVINCYTNLGITYQLMKDFQTAKIILSFVVSLTTKKFGLNNYYTINAHSNLAQILNLCGEHKNALQIIKNTISLAEKKLSNNHPLIAKSYSDLASILRMLNSYDEAIKAIEQAIFLSKKNYGETNLVTSYHYLNLSIILLDIKNYERAVLFLRKAITFFEKKLGEKHLSTIKSKNYLREALSFL